MIIDWFTVAAQILNFLVLVALLKHFLYDRIVSAMDEREQRIQDRLASAEQKRKEAEQEADDYRQRKKKLEETRREAIDEARQEAEEKRRELVEKAREAVDEKRRGWEKSLRRDQDAVLKALGRMAADEVYAVSRRTLRDLADAGLEENCVNRFLAMVEDADEEVREAVGRIDAGEAAPLTVKSGFELDGRLRQKITRKLHELVSKDAEVEYETDPDLVLGIEVRGPGQKIAWNADDSLNRLREKSLELLEQE